MTAAAKPWRGARRAAAATAAAALLAVAPPAKAQPAPPPAGGPPPAAAPAPPLDVDQLVARYLQQDRESLLRGRTQADQDDAARRLVARRTDPARAALLEALRADNNNPRAQAAAARALAEDPSPDPQWVEPLAKLLGVERATEAAAAALLNVGTDDAVGRVVASVSGQTTQAATLRALGTSTDLRVAAALVNLVRGDNQTKRVYAADALTEMTGLAENGRDPAAWAAWWASNRAKAPDRFRAELLDRRLRRPPALTDVDGLLGQLYQLADDKAKPEALRRMLDSPDAPFRAAAIRLLYATFRLTGRLPAEAALVRVRDLLRDTAPDVRQEAAKALGNLNDKPSLAPLLAQLQVEPDVATRVALMQAVVPMQDARAARELVKLLGDPSVRTATVAAETLAKLGGEIRKDAGLKADVAKAAAATAASRRAADDPTGDLQGACVEALVPLRDPAQTPLFLQLMRDAKRPARVRKAAAAGIGELRDVGLAGAVFEVVDKDRDDGVRIAALAAMERLGDPGFADGLFRLSRPAGRDDEGVKRAAARAFESLLPKAADNQIDGWADQLVRAREYAPLVPVLGEKERRLTAAGAARQSDLAIVLESIGDAHMHVGQPREAIPPFERALGIWQALKADERAYVNVRQELLDAYLRAELYPDAVRYAQRTVAAGLAGQRDMLPAMANEVDRLNRARQPAKALQLATEALKFPGIEELNRARFTRGVEDAKQPPDGPPGQGPGRP